MTYEEFKADVCNHIETDKPEQYRKGQFVFNYIEDKYKVARDVQFEDGVDCYYDDSKIESFLKSSYNRIQW